MMLKTQMFIHNFMTKLTNPIANKEGATAVTFEGGTAAPASQTPAKKEPRNFRTVSMEPPDGYL